MNKFIGMAAVAILCTSGAAFAKKDKDPTPTPAPAPASTLIVDGACSGDFSTTVLTCVGYQPKNVLSNNKTDVALQIEALEKIGFFDLNNPKSAFDFNSYKKIDSNGGSSTISFEGVTFFGPTYVGVHFGGGSDAGNNTGFYRLTAGVQGLTQLLLLERSSSGVVLYSTGRAPNDPNAVPEPATWAMMIGGFGLAGAAMRRRRSKVVFA